MCRCRASCPCGTAQRSTVISPDYHGAGKVQPSLTHLARHGLQSSRRHRGCLGCPACGVGGWRWEGLRKGEGTGQEMSATPTRWTTIGKRGSHLGACGRHGTDRGAGRGRGRRGGREGGEVGRGWRDGARVAGGGGRGARARAGFWGACTGGWLCRVLVAAGVLPDLLLRLVEQRRESIHRRSVKAGKWERGGGGGGSRCSPLFLPGLL
jgi:hypothetical protein